MSDSGSHRRFWGQSTSWEQAEGTSDGLGRYACVLSLVPLGFVPVGVRQVGISTDLRPWWVSGATNQAGFSLPCSAACCRASRLHLV